MIAIAAVGVAVAVAVVWWVGHRAATANVFPAYRRRLPASFVADLPDAAGSAETKRVFASEVGAVNAGIEHVHIDRGASLSPSSELSITTLAFKRRMTDAATRSLLPRLQVHFPVADVTPDPSRPHVLVHAADDLLASVVVRTSGSEVTVVTGGALADELRLVDALS